MGKSDSSEHETNLGPKAVKASPTTSRPPSFVSKMCSFSVIVQYQGFRWDCWRWFLVSTWVLGMGGSWRFSITKKAKGGIWGRGKGMGWVNGYG